MSSIRRTAFGFCLYCTYFTSKWINSLATLGPGCLAQRRSSRGLWGNQDIRIHFKSCLWTFFFQKDIWSRRLLPKAFLSSCPLGTWGHNEQIRFSCWEGDCVSMELSEPAPPSLDELASTAPEPRSPVSPPVNRGVFLTGLWEINIYMTLRSVALWSLYKVGLSLPLELLVAERLLLSRMFQRT